MNAGRVRAQTGFELRLLVRNGENLLVTLVIPLAILVFFTSVPVLPTDGLQAVDLLAPGAITLAVMGSALVSLGISTGFERDQAVIKRLGVTPLRRSELVASKSLAVLVVQAGQVGLLVATALVIGWRPDVTAGGVVVVAVGIVVASVAFAGIGLGLAGRLPALRSLAVINAVFLLFMLLAGAIVPLSRLPGPVEAVALVLPPAWLTGLLRSAFGLSGPPLAAALAVLTAWAVGSAALAARAFRWD